ncbi:MAG: 50S ribosomal protein L5 [SAR202 cluster bacterium]|nr:50S ribosomal protein L5 [SAR202 cluster bacterium]
MNEQEEKRQNQAKAEGEPSQPKAPRKRASPLVKAEAPAAEDSKPETRKPVGAHGRAPKAPKPKAEAAPESAVAAVASAVPAKAQAPKAEAPKTAEAKAKPEAAAGARPAGKGPQQKGKGKPEASADEPPALKGPLPPPRLLDKQRKTVGPALMKEFGYKSPMQVPTVKKIVANIGMGEALTNPKAIENATADLSAITGQKPVATKAKKSIAAFKVRQGQVIGLSVTLRGRRMWEFLDRLISSALPRIRDFRGVSRKAFDGRGNYSLGVHEQVIFPEIDYNAVDRMRGFQIIIVTSANSDREGMRLLELLGVPFERPEAGRAQSRVA